MFLNLTWNQLKTFVKLEFDYSIKIYNYNKRVLFLKLSFFVKRFYLFLMFRHFKIRLYDITYISLLFLTTKFNNRIYTNLEFI